MICIVDEKYVVSVSYKLIYRERLKYLLDILNGLQNSHHEESEDDLEVRFREELKIKDITDLSDDDYFMYTEMLQDYLSKHTSFPQIQYKALIVGIYSIIESMFFELVSGIEKINPKKVKFKNIRPVGSEIENYLNFLFLVYDFDNSGLKTLMKELKDYGDIRNNIIHKNANVNIDEQNRKSRIKKMVDFNDSINILDDGNLVIKSKFVKEFIIFSKELGFKVFESFQIEKVI